MAGGGGGYDKDTDYSYKDDGMDTNTSPTPCREMKEVIEIIAFLSNATSNNDTVDDSPGDSQLRAENHVVGILEL